MPVETYTKTGSKVTSPAKLDKAVFGIEINSHHLLKAAYLSYLAGRRTNDAVTKRRGQVRGGGRKPWRQKGTGNARFGSSRNPIWRGGGVAFGPTGNENYSLKLSTKAKHQALRQALSLAAKENRIKIIDSISIVDAKTKSAASLYKKIQAASNSTIVTTDKNLSVQLASRNLRSVQVVPAKKLNVYTVLNSDTIVIEKPALETLNQWLGGKR